MSVTVGTWIVNFIAAVHGGLWERAAGYTPTAMVAEFQHGLVRIDVVLIALTLVVAGLGLAAIWMRLGVAVRRRVYESMALGALDSCGDFSRARSSTPSWDTVREAAAIRFRKRTKRRWRRSGRRSGSKSHLAPEDPRRVDLERSALCRSCAA